MKKLAMMALCAGLVAFVVACSKPTPNEVAKKFGEEMLGRKCVVLYNHLEGEVAVVGVHPLSRGKVVTEHYTREEERRDMEKAKADDMEVVLQKNGNSWEATHWRWINR